DELPTPVDHVMVTAGGPYYARLTDIDNAGLRAVDAELGALFPPSTYVDGASPLPLPTSELPRIRGYDVQGVLGRGGMRVRGARVARVQRTSPRPPRLDLPAAPGRPGRHTEVMRLATPFVKIPRLSAGTALCHVAED